MLRESPPQNVSKMLRPQGWARGGWHTYPLAMRGHSALQVFSPFSAWPPKVTTAPRDNCHCFFPPPTLPPPPWQSSPFTSRSVPPPNQLRQLKLRAWGRVYDQCKQSTQYLHHKNRRDFPQYTPSFPIPSAFIHGDLWGSFIVLDRGDLELLEHINTSLSQIMVTQA